jgi:PQQ-like domain
VYSLGCVLFECLVGEPPFRREQDAAVMYAHLHDPPPSASAQRPELPSGVDQVIEKAMAKRSVDRYAAAGELAAAFRDATAEVGLPRLRRTHSKSKAWLAVTGAVIAVGVALTFVALARGQDDPASDGPSPSAAASALPAGSLAKIDPGTGDASRAIRDAPGLGRDADIRPDLAIGEGGVWMHVWPDGANALLQHFDEATGNDRGRLQTQGAGAGLAVGSRTVWFSNGPPGEARVYRINPLTHEALTPVAIGSGVVTDIVLGGRRLWVGSSDGTLTAFDPLTGRRLGEIEIDGTPDAIAYSDDSVWVMDSLQSGIIRVDPVARRVVARISLPGNLRDIAAGEGGVWVLDVGAGTATEIDP